MYKLIQTCTLDYMKLQIELMQREGWETFGELELPKFEGGKYTQTMIKLA